MPIPSREQIEKARQKAEQAKARLQAMQAQLAMAERKRDTRRKIILGGLLIDAAAKDDQFADIVAELMRRVDRPNDRQAFDGWSLEDRSEQSAVGGETTAPAEAQESLPR
ncbi:MAG: mobilization protein [Rhodospirillales bacterium]|nr:mobilization protein [Rhodospirillales bacterium]